MHQPTWLRAIWCAVAACILAGGAQSKWPVRELRDGHVGQVEGVAFSPDGRLLATADNSGMIAVRAVPGFAVVGQLRGANFTEVAWSRDAGTLVAGGFDSLVYVWSWPSNQPPRKLRFPGPVEAVAIALGPILVAAGGGDRAIRHWRLSTGEELPPLRGHTDDVYAVRLSPNGQFIVSGGRDRTIRVWDSATGRALRVLRGHDDSVYDLAFDRDGRLLVSGCRDGTVGLWSTQTWSQQRVLRGPANSVHAVAVSPNGRWLAGASFDNLVWVWSLTRGAPPLSLEGHARKVSGAAFSPDGRLLVSVGSDTATRIWNVP